VLTIGSLVAGVAGIAIFGIFLFLADYFQLIKGYSPVTCGLAFLPMIGCILVSSNTSSIVTLPRFGPWVLIATGTATLSTVALTATTSYLAAHHAGRFAAEVAATHGYTVAFTVSAGLFASG
jgi:hypothetical protein